MSRVVDGGVPRVVGVAGRQVSGVHKDGTPLPVLLVINRIDVKGKCFFVASMQDTRAHHQEDIEDDMDEHLGSEGTTNGELVFRVVTALVMIACMQAFILLYV